MTIKKILKPLLPIGAILKSYDMTLEIIGYNDQVVGLYTSDRYPYKCRRTQDNYTDVYSFNTTSVWLNPVKLNESLFQYRLGNYREADYINLISYGNLFDSKCQTLVNTINCVGVMGKGIALEFKYRYPSMFENYKDLCYRNLIEIGKPHINTVDNNKQVLNFPTKKHWRGKSEYEWIELGLQYFVDNYHAMNITSIAFPMLGCNNGGLDRKLVAPMMLKYLSQCDLFVEIYL